MEVFNGSVPAVTCRRLSGADCDEQVSPDEEACPAGHRLPTRSLPTEPLEVSGTHVRRPRLTVNEEYEEISLESEAEIVARVVGDPDGLGVARTAVEACSSHHGVEDDRSRSELRFLAARALATGSYTRRGSGYWRCNLMGMEVRLNPPGTAVVGYRTRHYERLPSEVVAGVPSRFKTTTSAVPVGELLPVAEIQRRVRDDRRISKRLVASWARRTGLSEGDAEVQLLAALAADAAGGTWKPGERPGTYILAGANRWAVRGDTGEVVASFGPPPGETAP